MILFRLLAGLLILLLSIWHQPLYIPIALVLMSAGLLSDILDGIIARKLHVSTLSLRRLDSIADLVFWICIAVSVFVRYPHFFESNKSKLYLLFGAEALTYLVSYIRFRREIATHAIASKFWTLILFATLVQLIVAGEAPFLFDLCFYTGLATRLEILLIILLLRTWTSDVPSVYHALQLRQGKTIRRHELFNG